MGLFVKKGYTYFLMQGGYIARTLTSSISRTPPFFSGQKDLAGHAETVARTDVTPAKGFHYFVNGNGNVTRLAAPATISDFESTYTNLSKEEKLSIAVSATGVDDHEQVGTNYSGKDLFDFLVMMEERKLKEQDKQRKIANAQDKEEHLDYDGAIVAYEEIGDKKSAKRVRKLKAEQASVKVDQTVVHGDYVDDRDTIIKDSVISKSSIGGGSSKMQELKELTEMKKEGLIDDAEFQQMKKEILGK
jgi:hypothetical protein